MDSVMPEERHARFGPRGGVALAATPTGGLPPDSGAGWTGMFMDSAASMLDTARVKAFGNLFSAGVRQPEAYGYSQLPVEMEQTHAQGQTGHNRSPV